MTAILDVRDLRMSYLSLRRQRRDPADSLALRDVSFSVQQGESIGIVGESGCGKTTLAKTIVGLEQPTSGEVSMNGLTLPKRRSREQQQRIQMVFQDPAGSLNPRHTVRQTLMEPLVVHRLVASKDRERRVAELMSLVELPIRLLYALPRELSGGQKQRVGIARALALEPEILIADEAVAALDVSVQAAVLNVLRNLHRNLGLTLLFITHDLAVVRQVSDRVIVMQHGTIIEDAACETIFESPQHEYTRQLLRSVPRLPTPR